MDPQVAVRPGVPEGRLPVQILVAVAPAPRAFRDILPGGAWASASPAGKKMVENSSKRVEKNGKMLKVFSSKCQKMLNGKKTQTNHKEDFAGQENGCGHGCWTKWLKRSVGQHSPPHTNSNKILGVDTEDRKWLRARFQLTAELNPPVLSSRNALGAVHQPVEEVGRTHQGRNVTVAVRRMGIQSRGKTS